MSNFGAQPVPEVLGSGSRIGDSEEEILEIRERGGLVPILVNFTSLYNIFFKAAATYSHQ